MKTVGLNFEINSVSQSYDEKPFVFKAKKWMRGMSQSRNGAETGKYVDKRAIQKDGLKKATEEVTVRRAWENSNVLSLI